MSMLNDPGMLRAIHFPADDEPIVFEFAHGSVIVEGDNVALRFRGRVGRCDESSVGSPSGDCESAGQAPGLGEATRRPGATTSSEGSS